MSVERPYSTILFAPDKGDTGAGKISTTEQPKNPEGALNRLIERVAGKRRTSFIRIAFDDLVDMYLSHLDETGETWEKAVDTIEANMKNRRYKTAHNTVKGLIEKHRDALREEFRHKGVTSYEPVRRALATNLEQARDRVNVTKQEEPAAKPLMPPRMWRSRSR